jgi:hypothetical protein
MISLLNQMKALIEQIYITNPKCATKIVKENYNLWTWINLNCDSSAITNLEKIYTAYSGELLLCPCGSGKLRKCRSFSKGLKFCGKEKFCSALKEHNLKKSKQTNLERYGVENIFQLKNFLDKREKTYLKNYGAKNPQQCKDIKQKVKQTNLERYGSEYSSQNEHIKQKVKQTNLERYGVENVYQNTSIQEKVKQTNLERYGAVCVLQNEHIKQKVKQTNLERYGSEYSMQNDQIKLKAKQTNLKRYGAVTFKQGLFSEETKQVLFDRENFTKLLLEFGPNDLAHKLNVSLTTIYNTHTRHGLNIIQSNLSIFEKQLAGWLTEKNISFESNNRKILCPQELDFYIPSHNLAIEFNGLYWHSEALGKNKWYHYNKTKACAEQNIRLIHIFEDEWINNHAQCLDIISRSLSLTEHKLMARKCIIKEITNMETKEFLDKNHLQGYVSASKNVGLYYNQELIQLMTFKKPRYNKKIEWELIRAVSKINYTIVGGYQKLWNYFIKIYKPQSIVSYSDNRWFTGNLYKIMGFTQIKNSKPTYWYTDYKKRWHRSRFTKNRCIKEASLKVEILDDDLQKMSEHYITKNILKLSRIWDCGQNTWIYNQKDVPTN